MKFSYDWLQTFFTEPLPAAEELAERITFHSSEIEELSPLPSGDTMLDVKVLPDRSAWLMSHRGLAREVSAIIGVPLAEDPFTQPVLAPLSPERITIQRMSPTCDFYGAALIEGVTVGPSPEWLKERLATIGQRSINNIVDATNYVMFELGQPLHAFDADKLGQQGSGYQIGVRQAREGEQIVSLTGEEYTLTKEDALIVDGADAPVGIAGIKGGNRAAVDQSTTTLLLESAHFDRVAVRKSAKRLKLPTDAAKRFENGISAAVAPIALARIVALITDVAQGACTAVSVSGETSVQRGPVAARLTKINSVLGVSLTEAEVSELLSRIGGTFSWTEGVVTFTPTFERDDIVIVEDLIDEIGRVHGLEHVVSVPPKMQPVAEFNVRHYYAEKIRGALTMLGFSEIYTSSFRAADVVKLENALATDKGYLRSSLTENMREARERNIPHRDLLGLSAIKLFEIGTVFAPESEEFRVVVAVQTGTQYKAKVDEPFLDEALTAITNALGAAPILLSHQDGIAEFSLDALLPTLTPPIAYDPVAKAVAAKYRPFSLFPAISRDIALWVSEGVSPEGVVSVIDAAAGPLRVRTTQFDEFHKEGRVSLAFRLVFQAEDRTLTDAEAEAAMATVYEAVKAAGWEVR